MVNSDYTFVAIYYIYNMYVYNMRVLAEILNETEICLRLYYSVVIIITIIRAIFFSK